MPVASIGPGSWAMGSRRRERRAPDKYQPSPPGVATLARKQLPNVASPSEIWAKLAAHAGSVGGTIDEAGEDYDTGVESRKEKDGDDLTLMKNRSNVAPPGWEPSPEPPTSISIPPRKSDEVGGGEVRHCTSGRRAKVW